MTKLFTPGPLNVDLEVKKSMLMDIGSRTNVLASLCRSIRKKILDLYGFRKSNLIPIMLAGSGTTAIEASLVSLGECEAHYLILVNGPYGERMVKLCQAHRIRHSVLRKSITSQFTKNDIRDHLHGSISHVVCVHYETGAGVLNKIEEISDLCEEFDKKLIVDCMSSFGALDISFAGRSSTSAVIFSSNKCLHSTPGVGIVLLNREEIQADACERLSCLNVHRMAVDIIDGGTGWEFTPPTNTLLALNAALDNLISITVEGRLQSYAEKCCLLESGIFKLGFSAIIDEKFRVPIINSYRVPKNVDAANLESYLFDEGYVIYKAIFPNIPSVRIGCIGEITKDDISLLVDKIAWYIK